MGIRFPFRVNRQSFKLGSNGKSLKCFLNEVLDRVLSVNIDDIDRYLLSKIIIWRLVPTSGSNYELYLQGPVDLLQYKVDGSNILKNSVGVINHRSKVISFSADSDVEAKLIKDDFNFWIAIYNTIIENHNANLKLEFKKRIERIEQLNS